MPFTTRRDAGHARSVTFAAGATMFITLVGFHFGPRTVIIGAMPANYRFLVDLSARILAQGGASAHRPRHTAFRRSLAPANDPFLTRSVPITAQNERTSLQIQAAGAHGPNSSNPAPRAASRPFRPLLS